MLQVFDLIDVFLAHLALPLAPHASALPGCATHRTKDDYNRWMTQFSAIS